jgi:hypothetical protein
LDQFKKERAAFSGEIKIKRESEKAGIRIQFTPRMLSALIVGGLLLILGTYVVWQIARLNQPPSLEINSPKDGEKITQTFVTVSGKTEPGMKLTINDEQVLVDDSGKFSASLGIGSGQKQLVIRSQNKFDKVTTKVEQENEIKPSDRYIFPNIRPIETVYDNQVVTGRAFYKVFSKGQFMVYVLDRNTNTVGEFKMFANGSVEDDFSVDFRGVIDTDQIPINSGYLMFKNDNEKISKVKAVTVVPVLFQR